MNDDILVFCSNTVLNLNKNYFINFIGKKIILMNGVI